MDRVHSATILLLSVLMPCLVSFIQIAQVEAKTITTSHTYIMGDNDSRNDARQLCFLEAKRKVLEKAGSLIEASAEVRNFQLTKDQISSYSAAVLSVEIIKEDFAFKDGRHTLSLTVKADVDLADVQKRLTAIIADKSLQGRIADQQHQIQKLEEKVLALSAHLSGGSANSTGKLRKERNVVFTDIQELENKKLAATRAMTEKTDLARKYIVRNMTRTEVRSILGEPRGWHNDDPYSQPRKTNWNYGELWVCFDNDLVVGVGITETCYSNQLK